MPRLSYNALLGDSKAVDDMPTLSCRRSVNNKKRIEFRNRRCLSRENRKLRWPIGLINSKPLFHQYNFDAKGLSLHCNTIEHDTTSINFISFSNIAVVSPTKTFMVKGMS